MIKTRVIPSLLLKGKGLVKSVKFEDHKYLGDPINIVRIFNEKEVPEMILLDITAGSERKEPNYEFISNIASECFMPLSYGGGLTTLEQISKVLSMGFEKVVLNTAAVEDPKLVQEASRQFGSQSIVVCIDAKRNFFGKYEVMTKGGKASTGLNPIEHAVKMEEMGAGELVINSIDQDGTMSGYDISLTSKVAKAISIPTLASGGAGNLEHIRAAVTKGGASAVVAGSLFVFHGKHRAVLINYPDTETLKKYLK